MRLESSLFGPRYGHRVRHMPIGFGTQNLLAVLLLLVAIPVFLVGAVVALPIGALVLSFELARSAWVSGRQR